MIERLSGPSTHICWTPDDIPKSECELVVLVKESDLVQLEDKAERIDIIREFMEKIGMV